MEWLKPNDSGPSGRWGPRLGGFSLCVPRVGASVLPPTPPASLFTAHPLNGPGRSRSVCLSGCRYRKVVYDMADYRADTAGCGGRQGGTLYNQISGRASRAARKRNLYSTLPMPKNGKAKKSEPTKRSNGNGIAALTAELWQAAVNLRGSIEPADYKRYVLPIIFLRFLSLRYERRRAELERLIADPASEYHTRNRRDASEILADADEYRRAGAFIVPENARWSQIRTQAQADDIKVRLDDILDELERTYPDKLRGLRPRIYAGSNLDRENVTALINLFSKDIFEQDHGGEDLIGRVYEYFIGEFASSEGKR